jgi:hypothetical protein
LGIEVEVNMKLVGVENGLCQYLMCVTRYDE